jgi:hypothetical protein
MMRRKWPRKARAMKDLEYIVSIGFSGADIWRALIVAFFLAMALRRASSAWMMGFAALAIDRIVWPIAGQAIAGAELQTLYASFGAFFQTLPDNLGVLVVRYVGLTALIALFAGLRRRIHAFAPTAKGKPA